MKKKAHSIDMLFMLVLFAIFAVMSVMLILMGSNVYGKIVDSSENNNNARNILSYVTNKVRTSSVENGVYVEEKDGVPVLVIENVEADYEYKTLIFCNDGKLKESTIARNDDYNLDFGDILAEVKGFNVTIDQTTKVLTISIESENQKKSIDVYVGTYR